MLRSGAAQQQRITAKTALHAKCGDIIICTPAAPPDSAGSKSFTHPLVVSPGMERHEPALELVRVRRRPGPADTAASPVEARRADVQQVSAPGRCFCWS